MAKWRHPRVWGFIEWLAACSVLVFVYSLTPWADGSWGGNLQRWVFRPSLYTWLERPWTALTYALIHADLSHLLLNLIALAYLYRRVQSLGSLRLAILSFSSILMGALFYTLADAALSAYGIYHEALALVGFSSVVFGLCALSVLAYPRAFVYDTPWGVLRLWHLVLGVLLLSLLGTTNLGGFMAHLGGGAVGCFCYWLWYVGSRDQIATPGLGQRHQALLQKARRSGIHSLTPEERQWLIDHGQTEQSSQ